MYRKLKNYIQLELIGLFLAITLSWPVEIVTSCTLSKWISLFTISTTQFLDIPLLDAQQKTKQGLPYADITLP